MSTKHGSHWLEREDVGPVTVARLKTPKLLDDDTTRTVFESLYSLVAEVGRNNLVLNLGSVEFLPSLALGKLIILNRKVEVSKGRLALCRLSADSREVLDAMHLTELFNIYGTEQQALQSFA
jgi:anti-anti-sigma factor